MAAKSRRSPDHYKDFVANYLAEQGLKESAVFSRWVKKIKKGKEQDRLLVLTKYRILVIKQGRGSPAVRRNSHLYYLVDCECNNEKIVLNLGEWALCLSTSPQLAHTLVQLLWSLTANITRGFPKSVQCCFSGTIGASGVSNDELAKLYPPAALTESQTFTEVFLAYSAYYSLARQRMVLDISSLIRNGIHVLDLNELGLADLGADAGALFMVIMNTLEYNRWFHTLKVRDIFIDNPPLAVFGVMMTCNKTLRRVELVNVGASKAAAAALAEAARECSQLQHFNLSGNALGDGLRDLIDPLARRRLSTLALANCGAPGKVMYLLLESLEANPDSLAALRHLDLAGNVLDSRANKLLSTLCLSPHFNLDHLSVANTGVDVAMLAECLARRGAKTTLSLKSLDVGRNDVGNDGGSRLARALCQLPLCSLGLTNIHCSPRVVENLVAAFLKGPGSRAPDSQLSLDVSGNFLGAHTAIKVASLLDSPSLTSLKLDDCGLGTQGTAAVLLACSKLPDLQSLSICRNVRDTSLVGLRGSVKGVLTKQRSNRGSKRFSKKADPKSIALPQLVLHEELSKVASMPHLKELYVAGEPNTGFMLELAPLLTLLSQQQAECRLHVLDLSGNNMQTVGTLALCRALDKPALSELQELRVDGNRLSLRDLISLADAVKHHHHLVRLPFPDQDMALAVRSGGSAMQGAQGDDADRKLRRLRGDFVDTVHRNKRQLLSTREHEQEHKSNK